MSKDKTLKILYDVYMITISVLLAALAILLIVSCVGLYRSGPSPFSRESVTRVLVRLLPLVGIVVLWALAGFIIFPDPSRPKNQLRGTTSTAKTLKTLSGKIDVAQCSAETQKKLRVEHAWRVGTTITVTLAYAIGGVIALIYTLDGSHFPSSDPNSEVLRGALTVFLCLILPFVLSIAALFVNQASRRRELACVKSAIKESAGKPQITAAAGKAPCAMSLFIKDHRSHLLWAVRLVVLAVAVVLIVAGISNGGARDVVQKAIKICRECIGLG